MEVIFFFILAIGILSTSALVIAFRNPLYSAISLVSTCIMLAGVYALLNATFLAIIQVMVYVGAIMVLFFFVIMLLNMRDGELGQRIVTPGKALAAVAALGLFGAFVGGIVTIQDRAPLTINAEWSGEKLSALIANEDNKTDLATAKWIAQRSTIVNGEHNKDPEYVLQEGDQVSFTTTRFPGLRRHVKAPHVEEIQRLHKTKEELAEAQLEPMNSAERKELEGRLALWNEFGSASAVGSKLYTKWLFTFEITALLLLAAVAGAVVMAKRRV